MLIYPNSPLKFCIFLQQLCELQELPSNCILPSFILLG